MRCVVGVLRLLWQAMNLGAVVWVSTITTYMLLEIARSPAQHISANESANKFPSSLNVSEHLKENARPLPSSQSFSESPGSRVPL